MMAARILVVDDSKSIRQLLGFVLRKAGHTVVEAADGRQALERFAAERVDLILCDLIMPTLDGLSFLRELRALPAGAATPVVMLTTESQESGKQEGKALGVKAWIVKPFAPQQILEAVARLLPAGG
jgi:two-component system chemotaxis response regulator CheY